jgi:hypothetical protein
VATAEQATTAALEGAADATPKYATDDNGRVIFPLRKAIKRGSEEIRELRFREAKCRDLRSLPLENRTFGHILDIVGKLCGQPPDVVDEISAADMQEVSALVNLF